jgi:hypothetical protein
MISRRGVARIGSLAPLFAFILGSQTLATPTGDVCRKEICDSAVAACMRADLSLNPYARTEAEKKQYYAQFLPDCMTRSISPDLPWYSPEMVARFLKCPL